MNVSDLSFVNPVSHIRIARIEPPIERTKQRLANFFGYLVAFDSIRAIFRYRFLAKDRLFCFQSFDNDILMCVSRRRHEDRVDALRKVLFVLYRYKFVVQICIV